ncbi:uncharacterized protein LOC108477940 [Gossypium arboreum]|uniref:uncharacterized protein LOC108477940 n=1 Tax=Gossypium arboreum TaxID=29729 RepID=UPI0008197118|nr:uncharacterized protein LOC108477940 [Gossypium arboreum]
MKVNANRAQSMNAKLYSCDLETFQDQEHIGRRSGLPPRSYAVDLRNRQYEYELLQTLQYPYVHAHSAYTRANLDIKQLINEVYTLQCTLHIWGNEFPIMLDVSNLEVSVLAFEMLSNHSLYRHPKGRPQSTRIQNDMDVREKCKPKQCIVCRTSNHNRSTCPYHVYVPDQYSPNARLEDDE